MNRNSKRNLAGDNLESGGGGGLSGQMFATMQTPRSNNDEHNLLPKSNTLGGGQIQPQQYTSKDYNPAMGKPGTVAGGSFPHHKKASTISMTGDIMKDAVDDPLFIEELMSGIDASRDMMGMPNIHVDRATLESDFTNTVNNPNNQGGLNSARDGDGSNDYRLRNKQGQLKNQIDNVLGTGSNQQTSTQSKPQNP